MHGIKELEGIERIHLMGVGGAGMSALALILSGMGFKVTGCDLSQSDYTPRLEKQGIGCILGHSPEHIEKFTPQLVAYSSAVSPDHEELVAARAAGIPAVGRGRLLSWLFNAYRGVGVAGTHGKTTTSSMIGLILTRAGYDPILAIGAELHEIGTNACVGEGDCFVAEIDESDGSFEFFNPEITVVTNVDWDHVNYFHSREDVSAAFGRFVRARKIGTPLIICAEDEGSQLLIEELRKEGGDLAGITTCGWGKSWEWGAFDVRRKPGGGASFSVSCGGEHMGEVELAVSGDHNIMNALLASATASSLGVPFKTTAETLREFHGAKRRLEKVGTKKIGSGEIEVIDDYGHHPTEITATLSAMRDIYPNSRLVVVFQPHRYTRTRVFYRQIASALGEADVTLLLPIYAAGELPSQDAITSVDISDIMNAEGHCSLLCNDEDDAIDKLSSLLREEDVLLTLGAGSISRLGEAYLKRVS